MVAGMNTTSEIAQMYSLDKKIVEQAAKRFSVNRGYSYTELRPYLEEIINEKVKEAQAMANALNSQYQTIMSFEE